MKARLIAAVTAVMLMSGAAAYAHHSFAATYVEDKTAKVEGKIIQFLFRNPHSFLHVEAPDEDGVMQKWVIEWGGAGALQGQGVTRDTLKVGDSVIVTGNPGRDPADHRMRIVTLKRTTDGFTWGTRAGERVE